jgi:hypothetical protein
MPLGKGNGRRGNGRSRTGSRRAILGRAPRWTRQRTTSLWRKAAESRGFAWLPFLHTLLRRVLSAGTLPAPRQAAGGYWPGPRRFERRNRDRLPTTGTPARWIETATALPLRVATRFLFGTDITQASRSATGAASVGAATLSRQRGTLLTPAGKEKAAFAEAADDDVHPRCAGKPGADAPAPHQALPIERWGGRGRGVRRPQGRRTNVPDSPNSERT